MESMKKENKEILNPEGVYLVGLASQPDWYEGEVDESKPEKMSGKIRGDLIIENLKKANEAGYSVVLIFGPKDNAQFINALKAVESSGKNKIVIQEQKEDTYSGAARDAIREAISNSNCNYVVRLELEKPMIEHVPAMVYPLINENAHIVITNRGVETEYPLSDVPERPEENLAGLSPYHGRSEAKFSRETNEKLKKLDWMPIDFPKMDWMGNMAWKNDAMVNSLFLARFVENPKNEIKYIVNPDKYSSSLFFPLITLFWENKVVREKYNLEKLKLVVVPIKYEHDKKTSELESKLKSFKEIRDTQREKITKEVDEFIRLLQGQESLVSLK